METPIQFANVTALPLVSGGACLANNFEKGGGNNRHPQNRKKPIKKASNEQRIAWQLTYPLR
jgi:hypothetical protein